MASEQALLAVTRCKDGGFQRCEIRIDPNLFADKICLQQLERGETLITQDGVDNELFFILSGRVSVAVNGREVAVRTAGQHVGEMSLIDPAARRSASVIAIEQTVVAAVTESQFSAIASDHPRLWRLIANELCDRLRQRNNLVEPVNPRPVLFIGSSVESLPIARTIQSALDYDDVLVHLWTEGGVFGASRFPIEDLERQVKEADFSVLVLGADDKIFSRGDESDAPRDNVIFELGLFMGSLSRERTFMVLPRNLNVKIPTDLIGLKAFTYREGPLQELPSLVASICNDLRLIIESNGPK